MDNIENNYLNAGVSDLSKRWSSGNIAQLMVLLNGLILTITAYIAINIFIQDMIAGERQQLKDESYKVIRESVGSLENTIKTVTTIVSLSEDSELQHLEEKVAYAVPGIESFDRILWVKQAKSGNFNIYDIKKPSNYSQLIITKGAENNFFSTLLKGNSDRVPEVVDIYIDIAGTEFMQESAEPFIKGGPFALVTKVGKLHEENGIIVGFSRVSNVIDKTNLSTKAGVLSVLIRDSKTEKSIFFMNRKEIPSAEFTNHIKEVSKSNKTLRLGSATWDVGIILGEDAGSIFLARTPWLILFFGLSLTFVGTLYVRNNQRQSYKLKAMNAVLAQKNYELNSEVSEREKLLQAMRKAERENRAIINSVNDIIFETDMDGRLIFINDTWQMVTGYEVDHGQGRVLFDMLHPQDQLEQIESFQQLVRGQKQAYRSVARLRTAEGRYRSIELAMSMLRQDENKNLRVVGTITDVEERRRAESALGEAEKKYRTIVDNAAGGIYQVTSEGHILSANPAMARILGYDNPDELMRGIRNIHEQIYTNRKSRGRFIRELESKGDARNFEIEAARKDGKKIWLNENARAVKDEEGNLLYFEGSIEDITARKDTEIKLKDAIVASDLANRAKSEFLANMSHELRTPLNAIIGFSEIIKNEMLGPLEQKQYWEYAKDIYDSGKNLLKIINDILEVSKIEASDRQLNESIIEMEKVVSSCLDLTAPKIKANSLSVNNLIDKAIPNIVGEEVAIKQIILNLLSNATKFTPNGGRITLSYELDQENRLRLSITDTGIGLDEHEVEKALSPFGQIETAMSRSSSGAGLGLTLVDSLIRLHGGKLELFSQKGIGTTATIIFPVKRVSVKDIDSSNAGDTQEEKSISDTKKQDFDTLTPASPKLQ